MKQITDGEIKIVGENIQFHGAARRMLERMARKAKRHGHDLSPNQVAQGLMLKLQRDVEIHADLQRVADQLIDISKRMKG